MPFECGAGADGQCGGVAVGRGRVLGGNKVRELARFVYWYTKARKSVLRPAAGPNLSLDQVWISSRPHDGCWPVFSPKRVPEHKFDTLDHSSNAISLF